MADRKIIIDILANVGSFLKSITPIHKSVGSLSSSASTASVSVRKLKSEVDTYASSASSAASASKGFFSSISPEKLASTSAALDRLSAATARVFPRKGKGFYIPGVSEFGGAIGDILDPGKIATAAGYRLAYGIADIPIKAIQNVRQGIQREIQSTSKLEGNLYDIQAYMLGNLTDQSEISQALSQINGKILQVGQTTSFTADQIAEALVTASKAGVTFADLGGPGQAGALDAIALFAQNTGESLEKTAEITAKLQQAFYTNLSKSQTAFGQQIDSAKQYNMVVNSLSKADASSAASSSQLAEALFNVGGSANNINMSFFETVALASAMVPAFESAASAGTSLKYVFSRMTGANSVKAQDAMKAYGLMDESGQSIFFDEKGFKGLEFMVRKLREVFGDQTGMRVDLRNKIITEIFGQDALKAVSRMISMDEKQVQGMITMANEMTEGARTGVEYAQKTADIKNEGLEFDLEYLSGSLDSLSKTLTMPLMKPFSNVVQSISGFANGMFAILQGANRNSPQVQEAYDELVKNSIIPNATGLFDQAMDYASSLKVGLDAIVKEGFTAHSMSVALASALGTSKNMMNMRVGEFQIFFQDMYKAIGEFVKNLPSTLTWIKDNVGMAFDGLIKAYQWIKDNWASIVFGLKAILAIMITDSVIRATNNWIEFGSAVAGAVRSIKDFEGVRAVIATIRGPSALASAAGVAPTVASAAAVPAATAASTAATVASAAAAPAAAATGAAAGAVSNWNTWTNVGLVLQRAWTGVSLAFRSAYGSIGPLAARFLNLASVGRALMWVVNGIKALLISLTTPIAVLLIAIAGMTIAWTMNLDKIQEWTHARFGKMYEYLVQTFDMIVASFSQAGTYLVEGWNGITAWFSRDGIKAIMVSFSNMFKGVVQILESLLLMLGGAFKLVVGLITGNGDLIKSGLMDLLYSIGSALLGIAQIFISAVQFLVTSVIQLINWVSEQLTGYTLIPIDKVNGWFAGISDALSWNGVEAGMNFAKGLAQGINDGKAEVDKAAGNTADSATKTIDTKWRIKSPAEELRLRGLYFGQGLALGIKDGKFEVMDAAAAVGSAAVSAVDNTLGYRGGSASGGTSATNVPVYGQMAYIQGAYDKPKQDQFVSAYGTQEQEKARQQALNYEYGWRDRMEKSFWWQGEVIGYNKKYALQVKESVVDYAKVRDRLLKDKKSFEKFRVENKYKENQFLKMPSRGYYDDKQLRYIWETSLIQGMPVQGNQTVGFTSDAKGTYFIDKLGNKIYTAVGEIIQSNNTQIVGEFSKLDVRNYDEVMRNFLKIQKELKTENQRIEAARGATSDVQRYIRSTGYDITTTKPIPGFQPDKNLKPYYVGGVLQYVDPDKLPNYGDQYRTTISYRPKTDAELAAMQGFGYLPLTQVPVGGMRGDFANLPLDQYSTPEYNVSQAVKTFQFATGDRAVAQRGLTDLFKNEDISNQFANIGNRAATYLSLRQGQLKPNEIPVFQDLLKQDRADRVAYMNAAAQVQTAITQGGDASTLIKNFVTSQQGQTQSFKDVFDVKIPSLAQYTADIGGSFDQYAKLGPQAFNEAFSVAVNPENQSAAFKALSPEAQEALKKSVQEMPSQAMAFLGSAMADGTLDSNEFDTYMQYVGEDIKNMRNILLRGTPPTQEELDAVFNPFIDGTATLVKSDQITGVLGNALIGASKVLFQSMGAEARDAFMKGWTTNEKGEKIQLTNLTMNDLLGFAPENLKTMGIPVGNAIGQGITNGIKDTLVTESSRVTEVIGPGGYLEGVLKSKDEGANIQSPSQLYYDEIGIPIGMGIAKGIVDPTVLDEFKNSTIKLLSVTNNAEYQMLIMNQAKLYGQEIGKHMMFGLSDLLTSTDTKLKGFDATLSEAFDIFFKANTTKIFEKYKSIGHKMAQGVATGFSDAKGLIIEALTQAVADDAVESATLVLKIKSPSRVFANKIGSPMAEGIAMGISNSASSVNDALNPLLDSGVYRPDISSAAIGGMIRRSQTAAVSSSVENNYNLSLATSYPGQTVQQQFEIMRAFKGRR